MTADNSNGSTPSVPPPADGAAPEVSSSEASPPAAGTAAVPAMAEAKPAASGAAHHHAPIKLEKASRQIRHLAQFAIVEETGVDRMARHSVYAIAAVVTAFLVWAGVTRVDEEANTFGTVVPAHSVQVVQHLEGGIIREILVEERALVEAGQVLMRLDPIQATAELEQAESRSIGLAAKAERLRAFAERREPDFSFVPDHYRHLADDQTAILRAANERWSSQRRVFEEQINQKREEIAAARAQETASQEQRHLLDQEVTMRDELARDGYNSKLQLFAAQRQRAAMDSEISRLRGQQTTAQKALDEVQKRLDELDDNERRDALTELGTATAEQAQVDESLGRLRDRVSRLDILSPMRGYVQNMKAKTLGAVVPAGGQVMEIVPADDEMIVEARVNTRDIGHVSPGQKVNVKVASFDFVRYGSLEGELLSVSATTYLDEKDNTPYYKARIKLAQPYVGHDPGQNRLVPGMTVQADIITGDKTLLQYILKPIHSSIAQAFHER